MIVINTWYGKSARIMMMKRFNSTSALTNRFTQILENKLSQDPRIKDLDAKLTDEKIFEKTYANHLGYLKLEKLLQYNQHGKQIATSQPWDGRESHHDANLRMILDLKPQAKKIRHPGKRLVVAKETSNEYRETKTLDNDNFKEIYKERFVGPTMLLNNASPNVTLNLVNTIASSKINSKINLQTGRFDDANMAKVRGKPLNRNHLTNATDSSYFVNEMLNKQQVLPPWVETQQELNRDITQFRSSMKRSLIKWAKYNPIPAKPQLITIFVNLNKPYATEKIKLINDRIRDYNLQAPSINFHKFKLNVDQELQSVVDTWYHDLPELINHKEYDVKISSTQQGFLSLFDDAKVVPQRPVPKLNLWSSFKEMFTEVRK